MFAIMTDEPVEESTKDSSTNSVEVVDEKRFKLENLQVSAG